MKRKEKKTTKNPLCFLDGVILPRLSCCFRRILNCSTTGAQTQIQTPNQTTWGGEWAKKTMPFDYKESRPSINHSVLSGSPSTLNWTNNLEKSHDLQLYLLVKLLAFYSWKLTVKVVELCLFIIKTFLFRAYFNFITKTFYESINCPVIKRQTQTAIVLIVFIYTVQIMHIHFWPGTYRRQVQFLLVLTFPCLGAGIRYQ